MTAVTAEQLAKDLEAALSAWRAVNPYDRETLAVFKALEAVARAALPEKDRT